VVGDVLGQVLGHGFGGGFGGVLGGNFGLRVHAGSSTGGGWNGGLTGGWWRAGDPDVEAGTGLEVAGLRARVEDAVRGDEAPQGVCCPVVVDLDLHYKGGRFSCSDTAYGGKRSRFWSKL
jgi:hypothetical protein